MPQFEDRSDDQGRLVLPPGVPAAVARPPVFNTFPAPDTGQPPAGGVLPAPAPVAPSTPPVQMPTAMPVVPAGTSAPGVIVQPPQPGVPGQPNQSNPQQ
jgi:hypothetical protein